MVNVPGGLKENAIPLYIQCAAGMAVISAQGRRRGAYRSRTRC